MILGFIEFEVFVNRKNHRGVKFFGTETVSAAYYGYALFGFCKSGANVEIKGFAQRTGFFRSV